VPFCDVLQFAIHGRRKLLERKLVAAAPRTQETRYFDCLAGRNVEPFPSIVQPLLKKFSMRLYLFRVRLAKQVNGIRGN